MFLHGLPLPVSPESVRPSTRSFSIWPHHQSPLGDGRHSTFGSHSNSIGSYPILRGIISNSIVDPDPDHPTTVVGGSFNYRRDGQNVFGADIKGDRELQNPSEKVSAILKPFQLYRKSIGDAEILLLAARNSRYQKSMCSL